MDSTKLNRVASWQEFETDAPEFAARARELFQARRHKTIATSRADGSPRISGIETRIEDGELTFGCMPNSVKGHDVARDPRVALHSPSVDPPEGNESEWSGEAKIAGTAVATSEGFRVEIAEVVLTRVGTPADHLVIESWHPTRGYARRTRT